MANLLLVSFLLVAGGIVFLLYGPTRRARPLVAVPRASLSKLVVPPEVLAASPPRVPPPSDHGVPIETISADMIIEEPPRQPLPAAATPPRRHAFVPIVNNKGPLPPLRSRLGRGTDSPQRLPADTTPTELAPHDQLPEEQTRLDTPPGYRQN